MARIRDAVPVNATDDPGWKSAWHLAPRASVPGGAPKVLSGQEPLVGMRTMVIVFGAYLVLVGVVVAWIAATADPANDMKPLAEIIVSAYGVVTVVMVKVGVGARLDCTNDVSLVQSYRTRMFLRVAYADSAAVLGLVFYLLTYRWWLYPLGLAFAFAGFFLLVPSARNLERDQDQLTSSGCTRDLLRSLRDPQDV